MMTSPRVRESALRGGGTHEILVGEYTVLEGGDVTVLGDIASMHVT